MKQIRINLTARYTIFLSVVVIVILFGSNLITTNVVRDGLTDLLKQRLRYAGRALSHYTASHIAQRKNDVHTLLSSPRFIAAISTGDASTVSQEAPEYKAGIGADFIVITNPRDEILFSDQAGLAKSGILTLLADPGLRDTVVSLSLAGTVYETVVCVILTGDGFAVGQLAVGYSLSRVIPDDLKRLTGFDAILSLGDKVIGFTNSGEIEQFISDPSWTKWLDNSQSIITESVINDKSFLYVTFPMTTLNSSVTFVTSVDEHIMQIHDSLIRQMLILAFSAGIVAILIIFLFTRRRIGEQITYLIEATQRIANNDMNFRVLPRSSDEFGELAVQLDDMRSRLVQNRTDLETAHQQQLSNQRLATIGQLAAGIIHDLKNPIAVIKGTAELITQYPEKKDRVLKHCGSINVQVDRINELCLDILDFTKGRANLNKKTVAVREYVENALELRLEEARLRSISLTQQESVDVVALFDPSRLHRVIDNLITNAIQALDPGCSIELSWTVDRSDLKITIKDNGPGIPDEIVDTLFEPFVTSGKKEGTGLGLAISQKIVEDHGGTINVFTQTDEGTSFEIILPEAVLDYDPRENIRDSDRRHNYASQD